MNKMCEEQGLIITGGGATKFWREGSMNPITLEWQAGSLFSPPINCKHQHFNGSSQEPAPFVAVNNAPLTVNIFHSPDFVFNVPYESKDRFSALKDLFSSELKPGHLEDRVRKYIPEV